MLPKLRLEGDVVSNCVAEVPVPVRDIEICAGEPFVLSVMEPFDEVAEVGANTALKFSVPPAATVLEVDTPETLNPDPLTFTCENVNVALPEFFSVITSELLLPTTTLPKETLVGLAEPNACRPVPLKLIVAADPGALLVIEMFPAKLPSDVGANVTEKIALAPALMLSGASVIE
jgi:hypothetical protein